jgi:hypothetical protein
LYNTGYDEVYFVTKFVSGIKEEIRSVIALHRPNSVDTASALALIQEEELDRAKQKGNQRDYNKSFSRSSYTGEKTKSVLQDKTKGPTESTTGESKLLNRLVGDAGSAKT